VEVALAKSSLFHILHDETSFTDLWERLRSLVIM
jgi:hypothetical protein